MNVAIQVATQMAVQAAAADERILKCLREGGARSEGSAVEFVADSTFGAKRVDALLGEGLLVRTADGRLYVDEEAVAARAEGAARGRQTVGRILLLLAAVVALVVIAALLMS